MVSEIILPHEAVAIWQKVAGATMTGEVVEQAEATITITNHDLPLQLSAK